MSEIKLLPCPFCGVELHKHHRYYHHEINGCLFDDYEFFEEDFEKWNTRKPIQEIMDRLEARKNRPPELEYRHLNFEEAIQIVKEVGGIDV